MTRSFIFPTGMEGYDGLSTSTTASCRVQDVDLRQGMAWGTSSWLLPNGEAPVETTWQGEIVDNCNHTFDTQRWGASHISDMKNWSKFSAFSELYIAGSILGSR